MFWILDMSVKVRELVEEIFTVPPIFFVTKCQLHCRFNQGTRCSPKNTKFMCRKLHFFCIGTKLAVCEATTV